MKILVIDNQQTRPAYVESLEANIPNADIIYTCDPAHGMELLEHQSFHVLLLELILSGTDGYEILKKVSENKRHAYMKTFVITHVLSDMGIQMAFQMGVDQYMIKPVNPEILTNRILESQAPYRWIAKPTVDTNKPVVIQDTMEDLEVLLPDLLKRVGTTPSLKGYRYLLSAIKMALVDPVTYDQGVTKVVYPRIAKEFFTTPSRVERAIRHAIEKTWDNGPLEVLEEIFGNTISSAKGKPTNSEFVTGICEYIRVSKKSSCVRQ